MSLKLTLNSGLRQGARTLPQCKGVLLQGLWPLRPDLQGRGQLRRPIHSSTVLESAARLAVRWMEGRAKKENGKRGVIFSSTLSSFDCAQSHDRSLHFSTVHPCRLLDRSLPLGGC